MRVVCGALLLSVACILPTSSNDVGLPDRQGAPDLSQVSEEFRSAGGSAFIGLTGFPTKPALHALAKAGLQPPPGSDEFQTFPGLGLHVVAGVVPPGGVERIARLKFVTAIEPSAF